MKKLLTHIDEDSINYWLHVALAVIFVWRAGQVDDKGCIFLLFGAAYLLIHAHGRRILSAIKKQAEEQP
jgi:hypothetical protein